jgi:hypothetical protein
VSDLWRGSEHEPLAGEKWSEERAEQAIASIVADAEAAYDGARWPFHPADEPDDGPNAIYLGVAGMAWGLSELGSSGWGDAVLAALARNSVEPDGAKSGEAYAYAPSYLAGEAGIALVAYRLTGDTAVADRLHELVLANLDDRWNELLWGAPGSLLMAEAMLAWTGEPRWAEAWDALADYLEAARDEDGLWTQHLPTRDRRFYGAAHGFVGNARALANGRLFAVDDVLERLAIREDGLANWLPVEGDSLEDIRVQWCHGAAGVVVALGDFMDEELALAGGELTWRAGPIARGSGLCHGTAGNAYAFLVLKKRTGDELWLDRARAFAMHAIGQVEREREKIGRGRYSLFTGDIGVALFLRHLLDGETRFPTMGPFA